MSYNVWVDSTPQHWNWDAQTVFVNINACFLVNIFVSMSIRCDFERFMAIQISIWLLHLHIGNSKTNLQVSSFPLHHNRVYNMFSKIANFWINVDWSSFIRFMHTFHRSWFIKLLYTSKENNCKLANQTLPCFERKRYLICFYEPLRIF